MKRKHKPYYSLPNEKPPKPPVVIVLYVVAAVGLFLAFVAFCDYALKLEDQRMKAEQRAWRIERGLE